VRGSFVEAPAPEPGKRNTKLAAGPAFATTLVRLTGIADTADVNNGDAAAARPHFAISVATEPDGARVFAVANARSAGTLSAYGVPSVDAEC
jgi:hypothetical protein